MRRAVAIAALALAATAPAAGAGEYDPGTVPPEAAERPKPSGRVLHVGRGGIQAAVRRARPGDTIRVPRGTYRGAVEIRGASKRGVRLVGDGATLRGSITVRDTGWVTVRGLDVRGGVAVDRVDRYVLDRLRLTGGGIVVRRSAGGEIRRVHVQGSPGAGIALAASPPLVRAVRTFVRESTVRDGAVGISLDRVRAVTVSRVRMLRNAVGVSATDADVVLADNVIDPPET